MCLCYEPLKIVEEKYSVLVIGFMFIVPPPFCAFWAQFFNYWTKYNTIILWIANTIQYNSSLNSEQNIQGIPHVLLVRGKPQGPGVRIGLGQKWPMTKAWLESDNCKVKAIQIFFQHTFFFSFFFICLSLVCAWNKLLIFWARAKTFKALQPSIEFRRKDLKYKISHEQFWTLYSSSFREPSHRHECSANNQEDYPE